MELGPSYNFSSQAAGVDWPCPVSTSTRYATIASQNKQGVVKYVRSALSPYHTDEVEVFHPGEIKSLSATLRRKQKVAGDVEHGPAKVVQGS